MLASRKGDFFSWEKAEFNFIGDIEAYNLRKSDICSKSNNEKYLAFTEKLNFIDSVKFCKKIGGEIAIANDFEAVQYMQNALSDFRKTETCPSLFYTGNLNYYYLSDSSNFIFQAIGSKMKIGEVLKQEKSLNGLLLEKKTPTVPVLPLTKYLLNRRENSKEISVIQRHVQSATLKTGLPP